MDLAVRSEHSVVATGKVIFMTGTSGVGKSTLSSRLLEVIPSLQIVRYGELLFNSVRDRDPYITYEQMRADPSRILSVGDIAEIDRHISDQITMLRASTHVVIELHTVTADGNGYRATPYNPATLKVIAPDAIIHLVAKADEVRKRVTGRNDGRPMIEDDIAIHLSQLQEVAALTYSFLAGCPLFIVDAGGDEITVTQKVLNHLRCIGVSSQSEKIC